jgi:cytochrome oxidase Cu insertion factor (SCO1/SenC/PrrC family)
VSDPKRLSRIALVLGLVALAVAVGVAARYFLVERSGSSLISTGTALIGGPFTLTDQNGQTRSDAEFRGELMLVYFGYTYCPDVCPTELQAISDAMDKLGDKAAKVQPIFITVDPARDTVAVMKDYVSHFYPRLIGLTGTPAQIDAAKRAYRVYAQKVPAKDGGNDYLMDHSGLVYLMSRDGKYLTHFTPQTTPEQMARTIGKYL